MAIRHRKYPDLPPGKKIIFRPWITGPDGRRIYASTYGKRVFPIIVDI